MSANVDGAARCAALRIRLMTFRSSATVVACPAVSAEAAQMAGDAGLLYVSCHEPGIRRIRAGRGFYYLTSVNRRLTSAAELARIASLAVPPAYKNVWICASARGHLQATGYDARGRKQYRYHPQWREVRDSAKFDRMVAFGIGLPKLRRKLARDLRLAGLPRDKGRGRSFPARQHACPHRERRICAVTTKFWADHPRNWHATTACDGRAVLNFRGKGGGVQHEIAIDDKTHRSHRAELSSTLDPHLFQYIADYGSRCAVGSAEVNDYLRESMGDDFTAKDFRTWGATLRALVLLARIPVDVGAGERTMKGAIAAVVKQVAAELRNTPAVCRKSYINPIVFERWRRGMSARHSGKVSRASRGAEPRRWR